MFIKLNNTNYYRWFEVFVTFFMLNGMFKMFFFPEVNIIKLTHNPLYLCPSQVQFSNTLMQHKNI